MMITVIPAAIVYMIAGYHNKHRYNMAACMQYIVALRYCSTRYSIGIVIWYNSIV